jgi:ABC-type multidrug transport system ATPase subunit
MILTTLHGRGEYLCERILIMDKGQFIAAGTLMNSMPGTKET